MKKKRIIILILIIVWMILVFFLSNQSANESSGLSKKIADIVINILNLQTKNQENRILIETIVRKLAHFTLYTLGGILIYLHINTYNVKEKNKLVLSQIIGTTYAITDEIHQIFIPGRSGEIRDVLIDSAGVLTGILLIFIIYMIKKKEGN